MPVRKVHEATLNAFETFTDLYPEWVESLFDLHFLQHRGAHILLAQAGDARSDPKTIPTAAGTELAEAWVSQWGFEQDRSVQLVAEALPVCDDFLRLFAEELERVGRPASAGPAIGRAAAPVARGADVTR
jgi:hypothetical protein